MKYLIWVVVSVVAANVGYSATAEKAVDKRLEAWVSEFERYAAQEKLQRESSYSRRTTDAVTSEFIDVLRQLPEPEQWAELRQAMVQAAAEVPTTEKLRQQRLQAGCWLLAYLVGDRVAIAAELKAVATSADQAQYRYALTQLQDGLWGQDESAHSAEKSLKLFEERLVMLEPVDETAVKQILGGDENWGRLKRLIEMQLEMQKQYREMSEELKKNKDESANRVKIAALGKTFQEKMAAEQQALAPYMKNPVIQRFLYSGMSARAAGSKDAYVATLHLPDLVKLVGRERAEIFLHRAFKLSVKLEVNDKVSSAMLDLVGAMVLAEIAELKRPSWGLVKYENATTLFEAFRRQFPEVDRKDYNFVKAGGYYLAGLIQQGRTQEAVTFITEMETGADGANAIQLSYEVIEKLEQTRASKLWEYYRARLTLNPGANEWDQFTRLSVRLNRRLELLAMIKVLVSNTAWQGLERLRVQQLQADAELATDAIPASLERLRALVQTPAETEKERAVQMTMAQRLLKLADLQGDVAGYADALRTAELLLEKGKGDKAGTRIEATGGLAATLNDLGRFEDGIRIGRSAFRQIAETEKIAAAKKEHDDQYRYEISDYSIKGILAQQLWAEVERGHWVEAQALLEENPWWGTKDVVGLLDRSIASSGRPVGYFVARIALARGDGALARRILEAQLVATPAVDALYECYLQLVGPEALPLLEKLAAADRYEERPLIWKARLQLDAKEWDAAIATLQQAITIDPSDGEQGRGDRMRVYAFMSLAMAGKGDTEKAAFFAKVVQAIRLSETADRWYGVGAYAHAIELYRESLGFFQDAYCIQSRLAVRLAEEGKMDEAAEYYRRAFELMPDSFGRVESHCFGCEHVFAGATSQGVAEKVFGRLLAARPDKAQLHYLSGYLREEQKRYDEAAMFYRQAVQLDPLYLNAWNRLAGLQDELKFTPAQRDDLFCKLVELDPAHRHVSLSLKKVTDLPRLWNVMRATGLVLDKLPKLGPLGELKASAARLAQKKDNGASAWEDRSNERKDAAAVLREHAFMEALLSYLVALKPRSPVKPSGKE